MLNNNLIKIFFMCIMVVISTTMMNAQSAFGKRGLTNTSVAMEFFDTVTNSIATQVNFPFRGFKLDPISSVDTMSLPTKGTIAFDGKEGSFRYYGGSPPVWSAPTTGGAKGGVVGTIDLPTGQMIVGDRNSTAKGAVVIEYTDRALVLPNVPNPEFNIPKPQVGLIVYDPKAKQVAVYNGATWTYF